MDARFLDLCAGSGAVGIEALSRGAAHATLVDRSRKLCQLIKTNLDLCRIAETEAFIAALEATAFLKRHVQSRNEPWDIVYYDPPYQDDYAGVLQLFADHSELLSPEGLLIVEHDRRKQLEETLGVLRRERILEQGDSTLSFYRATDAG